MAEAISPLALGLPRALRVLAMTRRPVQCPPLALDSFAMPLSLSQLADRCKDAPAAERANAQSYLIELCQDSVWSHPVPSAALRGRKRILSSTAWLPRIEVVSFD